MSALPISVTDASTNSPSTGLLGSQHKTTNELIGRGPIHPFPARMAPGIALELLRVNGEALKVLDPMAGSGTVLALARNHGHQAFGFDLDPLAVILAKVWTSPVDACAMRQLGKRVLQRAREIHEANPRASAYPVNSDAETRKFIRYWFDAGARRQLSCLALAVARVRKPEARNVMWCALSRLIITKTAGASLAMDLSHSRPHKVFDVAPIRPFDRFASSVDIVLKNCPQGKGEFARTQAKVKSGDARKLPLEDASIDVILTSPPYLNAIDYMRCSKFSLVWMGYRIAELRMIRSASIGSEAALRTATDSAWVHDIIARLQLQPSLSSRQQGLLARYVWDMEGALSESTRVLKPGGTAVYVVGDSTCKGTFIRNSEIVRMVAERCGLVMASTNVRELPANRRYLPPPKKKPVGLLDSRMRREVILKFQKR